MRNGLNLRREIQRIADIYGAGDGPRSMNASAAARGVDFLLFNDGTDPAGYTTVSAVIAPQEMHEIVTSLSAYLRKVRAGRAAEAGFCGSPRDDGLLLVAAAPLRSADGWVLAGYRIRGRKEIGRIFKACRREGDKP